VVTIFSGTCHSDKDCPLDNPWEVTLFRPLVGKIAWAALVARPDLDYSANILSRGMSHPTKWYLANHVCQPVCPMPPIPLLPHFLHEAVQVFASFVDYMIKIII